MKKKQTLNQTTFQDKECTKVTLDSYQWNGSGKKQNTEKDKDTGNDSVQERDAPKYKILYLGIFSAQGVHTYSSLHLFMAKDLHISVVCDFKLFAENSPHVLWSLSEIKKKQLEDLKLVQTAKTQSLARCFWSSLQDLYYKS